MVVVEVKALVAVVEEEVRMVMRSWGKALGLVSELVQGQGLGPSELGLVQRTTGQALVPAWEHGLGQALVQGSGQVSEVVWASWEASEVAWVSWAEHEPQPQASVLQKGIGAQVKLWTY